MADEQVTDIVEDNAANEVVTDGGEPSDKDTGTILGNAGDAAAGAGDKDADAGSEKDWRSQMAGGDEKLFKQLGRYSDLANVGKKLKSLQSMLSSGEYTKALPEDADEKTVAAWRKENGVPEDAKGYLDKLELPNGMVLGEEDKPVAESFAQRAHEKNWTPSQYADAVGWYYEQQDIARQQQEEADDTFKQESEDDLRATWEGADYRRNLTAVRNMMAGWPEGLADTIMAGRTADGRLIGDDPRFLKAMAQMALDLNPAATLLPGTGGDAKSVDDRLTEIRKFRQENPDKYDLDKKMQAEELELIEAQQKIQQRNAA